MDSRAEAYITKHDNFSEILIPLRELFLSAELVETIKWGMPTYTMNGKNIVGIGAFKSHCGIWFFKGGLLKDIQKVLTNAQEGKTQAMRQWRFTKDSILNKELIMSYVQEAIANEKKGLKIKPIKKQLIIPPELATILNKNNELAQSFEELTSGKKKEFSEYISTAKREATKIKRLEKIIPMILNNIGLNDKYRNC